MALGNQFTASFMADTSAIDRKLATYQNKSIKLRIDADGNRVETLNKSFKDVSNNAEISARQITRVNSATGEMTQTVTYSAKAVNTLGQEFVATLSKVAKFAAITAIIGTVTKAFSSAINVVKEFDSAMTEMAKVSEYSGEQLRQYTQDLGELGEAVGRTRTEMTEMTTGWLKAGYTEEDAAKLAKISSLLQNTADEQLEASEATSILVSQLKAYHMEADEAIQVTDILNKVSANEAVSSGDLAKGLTQASAAMATYGNDIKETTALLTAGTTVFQNKSQQVARG